MRKRSPLLPIFLIVLVDVFGLAMVIPLLARYAEDFGASAFVATLLSSVYAGCALISGPIIGRLSDRHGRKPLLLLSQLGTFIGFLIMAGANDVAGLLGISGLWVVFFGRMLDGTTAGNLSLAQAYISDHTTPENRAKSFAIIGIAFGVGFMFGPAISGQLAKYGLHWPFLLAACMSATSMLATYTLLPSEKPPGAEPAPEPAFAAAADAADAPPPPAGRRIGVLSWGVYAEYFRRPGLAILLAQFFLFQFAFSLFTQNLLLFAERRFTTGAGRPWGPAEVGWLLAYSGTLGILVQGGLIGRLVKKLGEPAVVVAGFASAALAYAVLGFTHAVALLYGVATVSAFGNGVLRPTITSRITQAVGRHEQGVVLGLTQSLSMMAMIVGPPIGGLLIDQEWLVPWALVAAVTAAAGLLAALASRTARPAAEPAG
jgi:MFS family permease